MNKKVPIFRAISAIFLVVLFFYVGNQLISKTKNETPKNTSIGTDAINPDNACIRTTRLDNPPEYDRALSWLNQKLEKWNPKNDPSEKYFPPANLINCIKVIEGDVKETTGAEGYFVLNSKDIKQDYYPITIDKSYRYADDLLNALILVHEITHVQQYIDMVNGKDNLSCIDKEVEAFYSSFKLSEILYPEERKTIQLRLEHDEDLHPQLQILNSLRQEVISKENLERDRQMCLYDSGKNDVNCVDNNRKEDIRNLILQDDYYRQQCGI